ncbi:MAG: RusA family crossover junction endodeoxyribonuclease [Deltaproteobacteria bacterium]|uniref:RusA family crossover junction endodeoxyribonuclease n=1 Tax=Candidatus Zymogenus saltonus TaxID=2844893 RepID=A0A9D8KHD3_9DELT|nr:RusA family crossover junction endodeoxyribonuclease [Candidatus Zymogenus saltonus]
MIQFTVYGEPAAKGRPRAAMGADGRIRGAYTPGKTRVEETNFRAQAVRVKPERPFEGPVVLEVVFFRGVPRSWSERKKERALSGGILPAVRPDTDNLVKLVKDALNGVFWRDDAQVVKLTAEKRYSDTPRTEVKIEEVENA